MVAWQAVTTFAFTSMMDEKCENESLHQHHLSGHTGLHAERPKWWSLTVVKISSHLCAKQSRMDMSMLSWYQPLLRSSTLMTQGDFDIHAILCKSALILPKLSHLVFDHQYWTILACLAMSSRHFLSNWLACWCSGVSCISNNKLHC